MRIPSRKRFASLIVGTAIATGFTAHVFGVTLDDVDAKRVRDTNNNGTGNVAEADVLDAGKYSTSQGHSVFVFQMTGVVDPSKITSADFSVTLISTAGTPTDFNIDAYAIRKAATPTILASDYETTAQLLMADFGGDNTTVGKRSLDATGQDTFATWLRNNWVDGEYLFIGLKTDPLTLGGSFRTSRFGSSAGGWTANSTDAQLIVTETPGADPYDEWAGPSGYNLVGGRDDDDDGDGLTNFDEFAFGLNPTSGASVNPIADISSLESDGIFSYTRLADSGLTYTVWLSTDLQDWGLEPAQVNEQAGAPDGNGVQTVVVELLSPPAGGKVFVRVKAEEPAAP